MTLGSHSVTIAATEGTTTPLTRTHVDSDTAETFSPGTIVNTTINNNNNINKTKLHNSNTLLKIFHQNIRGLKTKVE
jgi:hypothetical protein